MNLVFLLLFIGYVSAVTYPKAWERCKAPASNDYKRNKCVEQAAANIIKRLSTNGEPSLNLPKLDPLRLKNMTIGHLTESNPVGFRQDTWNNDLRGLGKLTPDMIHIDGKLSSPQNWSVHFKTDPSNFTTDGMYKINGKFLVLPLSGQGKSHITMVDSAGQLWMHGKPHIKNGVEYLKITSWKYDLAVKRIYVKMENLLGGGEIGENTNRILNESWEVIWSDVKPQIDQNIGDMYGSIAAKILEKIPYKDLIIPE